MAKYTNTAGFKAISNENTEEPSEKLPRPLLFLIVGGIIVIGFIAFLMIHAVASNHRATATADEAMTIAVTTQSYDYNELFGVSESTSTSEPATVNLQNSTVNIEIPAPREKLKLSIQEMNLQHRRRAVRKISLHSKAAHRNQVRARSRIRSVATAVSLWFMLPKSRSLNRACR